MFGRKRKQDDFNAEVESHIALEADRLKEEGLSDEEALMAARRAFGNVTHAQERFYESGRWVWWDQLRQDIRYGLRQLRRNPGFTIAAISTLALGIAANTTIFSAVSAILLRKPPVKDPGSLCAVASTKKPAESDLVRASAPDFKSWQRRNTAFKHMAAVESGRSFILTGKKQPESVMGDRVTPDYFKTLGIMPVLGRAFLPSESEAGNSHVVILSHSLWRQRYGSDPNIIGKRLEIDRVPYTIIGVMPRGASIPLPFVLPSLWTPLVFSARDLSAASRGNHDINMVLARLKPGVTLQQAQAEMGSIAQRLAKAYPNTDKGWGITVLTLQHFLIRKARVRNAMMLMLAVVGFVLLVACANIAGLLLARGAARAHELAVRAAVGASRLRLVRQMLIESLLIAAGGAAAGLTLSLWGIHLLRAGFNFDSYGAEQARFFHLDHRTLLFTLAISFLSAILFGLVPALRATKVNLGDALSESGRTGSGSFGHSRLRNALVAGEIAVAVAMLAGAGVMMQAVTREFSEPVGFNQHHLVIANLHMDGRSYQKGTARIALFSQVTEKVQNLPGVQSVGLDNCAPFDCSYSTSFTIKGQPPTQSQKPTARYSVVGPGYFRTMQIPLIEGREFSESDNAGGPTVAIVSREFARRYFPRGNAIGQRIEATTLDAKPAQIVGIVGNAIQYAGQMSIPAPQIYECDLQFPFTAFSSTSLFVRSRIAPSALTPMLRRAVRSVDKNQPLTTIVTMKDLLAENVGGDKLLVALMGIFAGLALALAAVGIYGIIAYSVAQRTREIGIRVALGAEKKDVLRLVLRQGGILAGIGCAMGLALALPLPHVFASVFSPFPPEGPLAAIAAVFFIGAVCLAATYLPARRAAKVDPMVALRYE